jgi:uncharacterized membrane protein
MEIFLLIVLIILVIIFNSNQNSKFRKLHDHLSHLQKQLQESIRQQTFVTERAAEKKEEKSVQPIIPEKKIEPEKKVEPPVIVPEEKIIEKKEEKVPPPVIEKKVETEKVEVPVIENPQTRTTRPPVVTQPQLSWWDKFKEKNPDLEKFIGENLLSKIAITILVLGVAFFVKYAIDQNWINEYARVGIGMLCGGIVMGFAHRLHSRFKAFSSVLVAGAIAIFYFTIAIGFHEYHIFSQPVAFVVMVLITAFSVFISVIYDRVELAALSIVGGFAVPFMLSTGEGNYKILFTYILILDLGMLVLAYMKKWNLINILAYAFTVILYSGWLGAKVLGHADGPYRGAFFFGLVFYIVFVLMNVVNNVKDRRQFSYVELIILISNTFVFYISGMLVLREWAWQYKGVYTVAMGCFNLVLALALYKYFKADKKLVYLLVGLTLTFATLAAPVQLTGNYITLFWGAEVAVLVWLSQRSGMKGFRIASMIVGGLTLISLLMDYSSIYVMHSRDALAPLTNKGFVTGICSALFLFVASFVLLRDKSENEAEKQNAHTYGNVLRIASVALLYLTGYFETYHQASYYLFSGSSVACVATFYHIVFTSLLGIVLLKRYNQSNNGVSFILLCLNVAFYTVFYAAPYSEMQERSRGEHGDSIGYIVHLFALLVLVAHVIITIATAIKKDNFILKAKSALLWIFGIFSVIILSNEVILNTLMIQLSGRQYSFDVAYTIYQTLRDHVIKIGLPIAWGLIAFIYLSVGIRKQIKALRIIALALLAVTIVKLFTYDINNVSEAGKIVAFIILGIVLLVMSFMYQKIKALIMDEEKNSTQPGNQNNETNTP